MEPAVKGKRGSTKVHRGKNNCDVTAEVTELRERPSK